jgi:hypothetical protein
MLIREIKSQATFVLECWHCSRTEREHKDLGDEWRIQMWKPTTTLIYNAQANHKGWLTAAVYIMPQIRSHQLATSCRTLSAWVSPLACASTFVNTATLLRNSHIHHAISSGTWQGCCKECYPRAIQHNLLWSLPKFKQQPRSPPSTDKGAAWKPDTSTKKDPFCNSVNERQISLTISETSLALPSIQAPAENHNQEWWLLGENPFLVQIHLLLSQFMQSQNCDYPWLPVRAWVRRKIIH